MPIRPDRLKQLRARKKISQTDLAQALGVSQQQVNRWENGTNDPSSDVVARIAQIMECSSDWLLGLVEAPQEHLRERPLSDQERLLVDLYRQRKLPLLISRLVEELAGPQAEDSLVVNGSDEPVVPGRDTTVDG